MKKTGKVSLTIDPKALTTYYYRPHIEFLDEHHEVIERGGMRLVVRSMGTFNPMEGTEMYLGMAEETYEALKRGDAPPRINGRELDDKTYIGSDGIVVCEVKNENRRSKKSEA
jgi:hypothetical protein